jgi:hypothetical protein
MTPRRAQLAMYSIELHEQDFSGEQFLAWLLGFPDAEETGRVVTEESHRAFALADSHYQRVTGRVAVLNPLMIAQVGFIQGCTFAAAAYGREPFPAGFEK